MAVAGVLALASCTSGDAAPQESLAKGSSASSPATEQPTGEPTTNFHSRPHGFLVLDLMRGEDYRDRRVVISDPDGTRRQLVEVLPARTAFLDDVAGDCDEALLGGVEDSQRGLFTVPLPGGPAADLPTMSDLGWAYGALLPDGRVVTVGPSTETERSTNELYLVATGETDEAEVLLPAPDEGVDRLPVDVSKDGRWLLYTESWGDEITTLFVTDLRDARPGLKLSPDEQTLGTDSARLTPDGQRVLYVAHPGQSSNGELWTVNRDGSGGRRITDAQSHVSAATWSPSGAQIMFAGYMEGETMGSSVYLATADGTEVRRVFGTRATVATIAWCGPSSW